MRICRNASRAVLRVFFLAIFVISIPIDTSSAAELISQALNGGSGNSSSGGVSSSIEGRAITFYSDASNLVAGDTNGVRDVFLRFRDSGDTLRLSVSTTGEQANGPSHLGGDAPAMSSDATIVAFDSAATNLVDRDRNGASDIFVHNVNTGETALISKPIDSESDGSSFSPSVSADGNLIAYQSLATNLVDNDSNDAADIFVYDRNSGSTTRACANTIEPDSFSYSPAISADGNFIAFASAASNLVPGDDNDQVDIFVCDLRSGEIERVSIGIDGEQGNAASILPAISSTGCFIAFKSEASNLVSNDRNGLVDVFVHARGGGGTQLISEARLGGSANDASFPPSISYDGRFVAFGSAANDIVIGDLNEIPSVYLRDRSSGDIRLVDMSDDGEQANGGTPDAATGLSGDGGWVSFVSAAENLGGNDTNQANDIFAVINEASGSSAASVCCECSDNRCVESSMGMCPDGCGVRCNAECSAPGVDGSVCVTIGEEAPTATPTASPTPDLAATQTAAAKTATADVGATQTADSRTKTAEASGTPDIAATQTAAAKTATADVGATQTADSRTKTAEASGTPDIAATQTAAAKTATADVGATQTADSRTKTAEASGTPDIAATQTAAAKTATADVGATQTADSRTKTAEASGTPDVGATQTAASKTATAVAGARKIDDDGCAIDRSSDRSQPSWLLLLMPLLMLWSRQRSIE